MDFVNPLFLVGLAGMALPVLIHILTRDRIERVAFSTLRFFAGLIGALLRRRRYQEMLLLAMRMVGVRPAGDGVRPTVPSRTPNLRRCSRRHG